MEFYIQRGENMVTKSVPLQSTEKYSICFKILNLNSFFKILNLLIGTNIMSHLMSHCYLFFQTNAMIPVFIFFNVYLNFFSKCVLESLLMSSELRCLWLFWLLDAPLFPPACTLYTKNKSQLSKILSL